MSDMMIFNGVRCTYAEWARLESEYKGKLDLQTKLVDAKREGRQEGRQEGRLEGEVIGEDKILGLFRQGHTVEEVERMLAQNRAGNSVPLDGVP